MESQHYNGGSRASPFLCRQSSTRWIPTSDQIRILRDLYYINGVRSPNAEQIQRITARLRQYGRVEGKNVFYWFQNHKARERQKKKLTLDVSNNPNSTSEFTNKTMHLPNYGVASTPASPGFYDVGLPASCGYGGGSIFRSDCCLSAGGDGSVVEANDIGWAHGVEPTNYMPWMYPYIKEEGSTAATQKIQTLPLFPTNSQEQQQQQQQQQQEELVHDKEQAVEENFGTISLHHSYSYNSQNQQQQQQQQQQQDYQYYNNNNIGAASLELTLNSYCCEPPAGSI